MVRYRGVRAADRRPLRQHGPQPVLRSGRVDRPDLSVFRSFALGGQRRLEVPRPGQQHLQPPGVRQPERVDHVRHFGQITGIGKVAAPTSNASSSSDCGSPSRLDRSPPRQRARRGIISGATPGAHVRSSWFHPRPRDRLRRCLAPQRRQQPRPRFPVLRSRPFLRPCARRSRAPVRAGRGASGGRRGRRSAWPPCCTRGSNGKPRTRPMRGRRPWRPPASTGTISTRSCCSGWRVTAMRPTRCAGPLAHDAEYLPARVRLAEALFEAGELAGEPAVVRGAHAR